MRGNNSRGRGGYSGGNGNQQWDNTKKSHFIMIPIEDKTFIDAYSNLCNEFGKVTVNNFHPELLQKPGKLHMTVCTLDLGDDQNKIDKVHQIMSSIENDMKALADSTVLFNFEKYETMGKVNSARVVFAKMLEDEYFQKLSEIVHLIIYSLVEGGALEKNSLSEKFIEFKENKYRIQLHLTLLNVLFLNKILKKQRMKQISTIDATGILEYMSDKNMPSAEITHINFCRMREDKKTEKYELLNSYFLK
jgi:hypothetical protein